MLFGITGDLAHKMTFPALYRLEARGLLDFPVVGVATSDITTGDVVGRARKSLDDAGEPITDAVFARLAARLA